MKPALAVSLGDPAGIGPEIVLKAWAALRRDGPAFAVIGDPAVLVGAQKAAGGPFPLVEITTMDAAPAAFETALPVIATTMRAGAVVPGRAEPAHAPATLEAIELGTDLVLCGAARALVTAPISKAPLYAAGFRFPGHTEFIADICARRDHAHYAPVMMLTAGDLRVALTTIHVALRAVSDQLTTARIETVVRTTARALECDFRIAAPRIAVAGLNPHAGEGGAIGREEADLIEPAITRLQAQGLRVSGPHPADTLFHADARTQYDAAVVMYHDQGLIPVKMLDFWGGVNVTLGLPIVRTSPDHGTAHDIAGRGLARCESLIAALRLANQMADNRARP